MDCPIKKLPCRVDDAGLVGHKRKKKQIPKLDSNSGYDR